MCKLANLWPYASHIALLRLKCAVCRELKRRVEELEAELKEAQQSDARAALAVLEGRIKQEMHPNACACCVRGPHKAGEGRSIPMVCRARKAHRRPSALRKSGFQLRAYDSLFNLVPSIQHLEFEVQIACILVVWCFCNFASITGVGLWSLFFFPSSLLPSFAIKLTLCCYGYRPTQQWRAKMG
eukprot:1140268-Pelagomonas_calceolata.AAC.2